LLNLRRFKISLSVQNEKLIFPVNHNISLGNIDEIFTENWVVNSRRPFGGAEKVLEYLGRYTYRTAISNKRILSVSDNAVSFDYKDYRDPDQNNIPKHKTMSLRGSEFISRFLQHIPSKGFRRIRFYGIAGGAEKRNKMILAHSLFGRELHYSSIL
jgi:hypothetical protein